MGITLGKGGSASNMDCADPARLQRLSKAAHALRRIVLIGICICICLLPISNTKARAARAFVSLLVPVI